MSKQFYFKQFGLAQIRNLNAKTVNSWNPVKFYLTHRTLSGTTTPGQSGPGSDGNVGVLCILKALALLEPNNQIV